VASAGLYASLHLIPDSHANIPPLSFLQAGCPSCRPTNSVKALKAKGMRVNMSKTKVMISGEWQKVMQKSVRWPCGVCVRGIGIKLHRLTERDSRLAHFFALFLGLGLRLGYIATSNAKSDVIFVLGDPDFLQNDEISRISRTVFEIPFWGILEFRATFGIFS